MLKNCVYRGKAAVGIQVLMGSVFLCHPVLHYTILIGGGSLPLIEGLLPVIRRSLLVIGGSLPVMVVEQDVFT